jgi:hypothetical protein
MAAALAVRRQHQKALGGNLGGDSEGQHSYHAHHTLGAFSFDFSNRTKSEQDAIKEQENNQIWRKSHQSFPKTADIVQDLELSILVGR